MQHVGSFLVAACKLLVTACGIYFPDRGSNPGPLHWEHGVSATGPPGKSLSSHSIPGILSSLPMLSLCNTPTDLCLFYRLGTQGPERLGTHVTGSDGVRIWAQPYGFSIFLQCGRPGFNPWVGKIPWRRQWQPTPVLFLGKSHGQRSLVQAAVHGGPKEPGTTEQLHFLLIPELRPWPPCTPAP